MDEQLKQRLVGAAVLVAVAVIFVPMLVGGPPPDTAARRIAPVPPAPREGFNSSVIPLGEPRTPMLDEQAKRDRARLEEPASEPAAKTEPAAPSGGDAPASATEPARASVEPAPASAIPAGAWVVQLGSFANSGNARNLRDRLRAKGYSAFIETARGDGRSVTRVFVGPELDRAHARKLVDRLLAETRLKGMVVRYSAD